MLLWFPAPYSRSWLVTHPVYVLHCYFSHVWLSDPTDCSPPGSSVHGILQARVLEWVAMPSSKESFQPRDRTKVSHIAGRFFTIWDTREARWVFVPVLVICQVWRSLTEEKFSKRKDITTWDRYTVIVPSLPRGPVSIFIGNCAEMRGAQ